MAAAKPPALLKSASLKPALLARKGGARPAIRSPQQELTRADDADVSGIDLPAKPAPRARSLGGAKVVSLNTIRKPAAQPPAIKSNAVRRQREQLAERLTERRAEKPALRPAAFTLRLDAERHLRLRLASALSGRSAQQLVVEALDSMLANLPEVAEVAARAGKQR